MGVTTNDAWSSRLALLFYAPVLKPWKQQQRKAQLPLSSNIRGAMFMVIAMAAFTFNDTLSKLASQTITMNMAS